MCTKRHADTYKGDRCSFFYNSEKSKTSKCPLFRVLIVPGFNLLRWLSDDIVRPMLLNVLLLTVPQRSGHITPGSVSQEAEGARGEDGPTRALIVVSSVRMGEVGYASLNQFRIG